MLKPLALIVAGFVSLAALAREDTVLDAGWKFNLADSTNAAQSDFNDAGWSAVTIPHNWGWEDAQQGKGFYRGPGWYRRVLDTGAPEAGKRYFLRFEAASQVADVYLNGSLLGQHRGAFGAFCFEITRELSETGKNLLAVRVDNALNGDIAPLKADFSVYGGLYRPVHLIVTGRDIISLTDHAGPGVAWSQTRVSEQEAVLDVTAQISNGTSTRGEGSLFAAVYDAAGNLAASAETPVTLVPKFTSPAFLRITVPHPHLWNGKPDPYLYRAVVEWRAKDHQVADTVEQSIGLRYYAVDPEKGFFLNGKPYHLHGVNRHQETAGKGWAITESDIDRDIALLKEIGATVVRCCHYQHRDYFYSQCDRAGLLVWAEIPQVDLVHSTESFEAVSRGMLLDLIRQNLNHPSIFAWSLGNEIGNANTDDPHGLLQSLNRLAHGEDPTRPSIFATCQAKLPQMNRITDLLGWNIYPGWYRTSKENYPAELDALKNTSRQGGFSLSEYGAGANPAQHEVPPHQPKTTGPWHPEEWQAEVHEAAWSAIKTRPFVWGSFVWNMFDFAVHSRHEGGQEGLNDKGLVTRDRQIKKDAFYFYKANWSAEPMVYITSRRFVERTNAVTPVKIYSNAAQVELKVNDVSAGAPASITNGVFIWTDVKLAPGENRIQARAQKDGKNLADDCVWRLKTAVEP